MRDEIPAQGFIRNVRNFKSFAEMKHEIEKDVAKSFAVLSKENDLSS